MLHLGPLAFAAPWMLLGLVVLPAIWWLLRISPPLPKRVRFPAIRLLVGLAHEEETPAHTPLWLLLLRSALAVLVVLALADPLWNPVPTVSGKGPLLLVVDDDWAAATHWRERIDAMQAMIANARRNSRPVLLVGTAPSATAPDLEFGSADDAAARARALEPKPFPADRIALMTRLEAAPALRNGAQAVWLSDGLDDGTSAEFSSRLSQLAGAAGLEILEPRQGEPVLALLPPATEGEDFIATVIRADATARQSGSVHAVDAKGSIIGDAPFTFAPDERKAQARFTLPLELRNSIARLEIADETSVGATSLIDERWRRRTVGLVSGSSIEDAQPLLSDLYYLQRAIAPYAQIRTAARDRGDRSEIQDLLSAPLSVLVLSDVGTLNTDDRTAIRQFVDNGGVLVRFAGPKLAALAGESDDLISVPLRSGGRELGGALSWTNPQHLAPFDTGSPFYGLAVPNDVTVARQVLAEPTLDLANHTWARLQDGTPLVTAATHGKGLVVLFHVTANSEWSNLPLSGLFVEMLRRVIALSQGVATKDTSGGADATLSPVRTLDGFGRIGAPPATATPVSAATFDTTEVGPRHPPGLYGPADGPRALNLVNAKLALEPFGVLPGASRRHAYAENAETQLRPWALALALVLLIADGIAALYVTGLFDTTPIRRRRRRSLLPMLAVAIGAVAAAHAMPARADDAFDVKAATETHLAYVITGDQATDDVSRAGLAGLSDALRTRTAFEPAAPMGVDVAHDELAFFPLLYWPMTPGQDDLSPEALARVDSYMKNGGTILFDTRDQDRALGGQPGPGTEILRRLMSRLDLPVLEPVPQNHVLTKSFYLLHSFPGRWSGGQLWVEAGKQDGAGIAGDSGRANDDVSPIIIGSNDYAAAWAHDSQGRPMFPCEPGGEEQREMAIRFGVNLVMYALTGNYKSDQVHVPALLERLGQ